MCGFTMMVPACVWLTASRCCDIIVQFSVQTEDSIYHGLFAPVEY